MSIVFDFADIAARMNCKPVNVEPGPACGDMLMVDDMPSHIHTTNADVWDFGRPVRAARDSRLNNSKWLNMGGASCTFFVPDFRGRVK